MNKSVAVTAAIVIAALIAGCSSSTKTVQPAKHNSQNSNPRASNPTACLAPRTAYLFPGGAITSANESDIWTRLSLFPPSRHEPPAVLKDELVEAVIPSGTTWTIRDLRVDAADGAKILRLQKRTPDNFFAPTVVGAVVCFTSWNSGHILKLSTVTGAIAERASLFTRGTYMVTPTEIKPGGSMYVMVLQGSSDGAGLYNNPYNPNPAWYAVPYGSQTDNPFRVYPVSEHQVTVGNMDLVTFGLPQGIERGTYILAPLDENQAQHPSPMMLNGALTADFTFQVK